MDALPILTLRFAVAIGLYMVAIGIGGLLAPDRWRAMIDEMERSAGLTTLMGVVTFIIGTAIYWAHHSFHTPLAAIITIIGIIAALEGLILLAVPSVLFAIAKPFLAVPRIWAAISIALGLILFLLGLTGRATPLP